MELRLKSSDEYFPLVNMLSNLISVYSNPQLFYDIKDMPEVERLAEIQRLKNWMEELMH